MPTVTIKINDTKIKYVKKCKYRGVIIDDELKWTSHIEFVLQKLKKNYWVYYTNCVINYRTGAYKTFILHLCIHIIVWFRSLW